MKIPIGIVDDHQLFLKSLGLMLSGLQDFEVTAEALNGKDLQAKLATCSTLPEIMLIDVNMPVMDGYTTAKWLKGKYPSMKLIALSMDDSDQVIIKMIKAGCCAYLLKDTHPNELENALQEIHETGHYNQDAININYRRLLQVQARENTSHVSEKEKHFLQLACSDLTYKEIAQLMKISERTVDGYREALFAKLEVKSRVGLVMECIKKGIIKL